MEEDVAAARAAGNPEGHPARPLPLGLDRLPDRQPRHLRLVSGEARLVASGGVDHVAGKEEDLGSLIPAPDRHEPMLAAVGAALPAGKARRAGQSDYQPGGTIRTHGADLDPSRRGFRRFRVDARRAPAPSPGGAVLSRLAGGLAAADARGA